LSNQAEQNKAEAMQEISGVKWRETEGPNEKDNDGNPFSVESSLKI